LPSCTGDNYGAIQVEYQPPVQEISLCYHLLSISYTNGGSFVTLTLMHDAGSYWIIH